jgi:intracellular sulfur oxidation DsrE/DsrF family protein
MHRRFSSCPLMFILAVALLWCKGGSAAEPDDRAALQGLHEAKIAFDITEGDGKALLAKLAVIDETRQSLIQQGVTPHFVLAFRSGATFFVQTEVDKIKPEHREYAPKIVAKLQELKKAPGIESLEQCSVAIRLTHITADHIVPEVKVVGNGWISLMAYQARGYAYIQP